MPVACFPGGAVVKNPPAHSGDAGDLCLIPGLGRFPGGGNGNPHQYSCLGNPMDRGAWRPTIHRVTKNQTRLTKHATPCYLDYSSFVEQSEVMEDGNSQLFCFFLKIALAIWGLLWFHVNFKVIFSGSMENVMGILIRIALNL